MKKCRAVLFACHPCRKPLPGQIVCHDAKARGEPAEGGCPTAGGRCLLGGHLLGFAFLAHELQFALCGFDLGRDFLLHTGCRFFQLR